MQVTVESSSDDGGGGGAYNSSWKLPRGDGIECEDGTCVFDQNRSDSDELELTMETDPTADDANVEFAVNDTETASINSSSTDDRTSAEGNASVTLSPLQDGSINAYTWSGGSGDTLPITFVNVSEEPFFDVEINRTNSPVREGETLEVDVNVTNTGSETDTQTIDLNVDNDQGGSFDINADEETDVELDPGESQSFNLTYTTQDGDAPEIDFEVLSDDDREDRTVTVNEPAFFNVTITGTNSPVTEGDDLEANITVENTGDLAGTQDISLKNFTDDVVDTNTSVQLDPGESTNFNLTWTTSNGDAGSGNVTVSSENDKDLTEVTVEEANGFSSVGATDIVPNADGQGQSFVFRLDDDLPNDESLDIVLDSAQQTSPLQVDYSSASIGANRSLSNTNVNAGSDTATLTVSFTRNLSAGEAVRVTVTSVNAGSLADQSDPYETVFQRSDVASNGTDSFEVSRNSGSSALRSVTAEDVVADQTGQVQNLTFTLDRDLDVGWYEVPPRARRHVSKPLVRGGFDAPVHPER